MPKANLTSISVAAFACLCVLSGCKNNSIQQVNMVSGADLAVTIKAPTTAIEIRNVGSEPADVVVEADRPIMTPPVVLMPNQSWKHEFPGSIDLLLHNRGQNTAQLQIFTPNWNEISMALFPNGRGDPNMVIWIVRPQSESDYNETPAEEAPY